MAVASQYCCSLHSCLLIHQHALERFCGCVESSSGAMQADVGHRSTPILSTFRIVCPPCVAEIT